MASKVLHPSEKALQAAHTLVYLQGHRVQTSSMDTYATALHRFIDLCTNHLRLPLSEAMPPGKTRVVDTLHVLMFITYASTHYKQSPMRVTLKGAPADSMNQLCTSFHQGSVAICGCAARQGGSPSGETGHV